MKVKVHPINKYAVLKQNAKAPTKAAKMKTALESYARFKQGRAPKSLEVLHDLRGSLVTACFFWAVRTKPFNHES